MTDARSVPAWLSGDSENFSMLSYKTNVQVGVEVCDNFSLDFMRGFLATDNPQWLNFKGFLAVLPNGLTQGKVSLLRSSTTSVLLKTTVSSVLHTLDGRAMGTHGEPDVEVTRNNTGHLIDDVVAVGSLLAAGTLRFHSFNIP